MDSDVSICIIPDTPSPSVLRGNTLPQENVDVKDIPSEESFRSNCVSDMKTYIEGLSPSLPSFATNSVDRFSDSPVFSCKRKLLDNAKRSEQDFGIHRHKLNTFSSDVNAPALPGSPEFAHERAKALKKKKVKNNLSPFTKSKYDLSPFKTGVNQLSACSPQKIMKNDLNSRWSPSPLEKEQICSKKKNEEYSGFVKSSSLLRKFGLNTNTSKVSAIPECSSPEKSKKRKVETASSRSAFDVVRPKVKKAKANYGWPSSSGSSDDESYVFSKCKKRKKKTVKSDDKGCAFKNQDMQLMNNATELESNNTKLPKGKVGKKTRTSWTVTSTSENDESCNNIPVLRLKAVKQNEKKGIKCIGKKNVSGKVYPGPIDYLDSCDDEFLSSVVDYSLPGHENSVKSRKERKSACPNAKIQSSPPSVGPNVSPKCPSSSDRTKSFSHGTLHNNYNIFTPPTCSPALSSYLQFLDRSVTNNEQSTTSRAQMKSKSTKLRRNLHPSLMQVSPERQRVDTQSNSSGSPLGSQANPIDLESATPETKKALEEIKQLQSDEEFARKMQEQLDLEFAMSLQNREESGSHRHSEIPQEASSHSEDASPSLNWHAYAPTRVRAGSVRGIAAGNRRRARGGFLDEPWMQLLARESMMREDLGSGNIQVDGWVRHPVSPGRRRRGGRRGVGLPFFSPNAEGGDYENLMNLAEMLGDAKEKGLSKSDLGRLPIVSYKKTGQEPEECNICMADYEIGDSQKILPCFHSFHSSCIDKWIKKNATCPICRVEVKV